MSEKQVNALLLICEAITEAVRDSGPLGMPSGHLYAALSGNGCTLEQFNNILDAIVAAGRLTKRRDVYYIAETPKRMAPEPLPPGL